VWVWVWEWVWDDDDVNKLLQDAMERGDKELTHKCRQVLDPGVHISTRVRAYEVVQKALEAKKAMEDEND